MVVFMQGVTRKELRVNLAKYFQRNRYFCEFLKTSRIEIIEKFYYVAADTMYNISLHPFIPNFLDESKFSESDKVRALNDLMKRVLINLEKQKMIAFDRTGVVIVTKNGRDCIEAAEEELRVRNASLDSNNQQV